MQEPLSRFRCEHKVQNSQARRSKHWVGYARGYPYFLQEWGYHVWNAAKASPITIEDVGRAAPGVQEQLDGNSSGCAWTA